jgi:hypothetical protein
MTLIYFAEQLRLPISSGKNLEVKCKGYRQGPGSVTFWYVSGSSDTDPDADPAPALCVSDLQDVNKNYFSPSFYANSFFKVHLHHTS